MSEDRWVWTNEMKAAVVQGHFEPCLDLISIPLIPLKSNTISQLVNIDELEQIVQLYQRKKNSSV